MSDKIKNKPRTVRLPYMQIFLVLFAFGLMVFFCYIYFSGTKREHLRNDAFNALVIAQKDIESNLKEQEMTMNSVVRTVLRVIRSGGGAKGVAYYLEEVSEYLFGESEHISGFSGVYGCFDIFDGINIHGGGMPVPEGFLTRQPGFGYLEAVEAKGKTVVTEPYTGGSGEYIITYACQLLNENKEHIGVAAFNVPLDKISEIAVGTQIAGGYGFLVDTSHKVIAHPSPDWLGVSVAEMDSGAEVKRDMEQGKDFFEYNIRNIHFKEEPTVLSYKRLSNSWYLGTITPRVQYYAGMRITMWVLVLFGTVMAALLSAVLVRIYVAKNKADARMRQADEYTLLFFDATPTCCTMWDKNNKIINCNQTALQFFGLRDREEFNEKFLELSPEFQPNGESSEKLMAEWFKKAFETGFMRVDWMHRTLSGELLPCEVTGVRVNHGDEALLAVYTRDMREIIAAMDEIRKQKSIADETKYLSEHELMRYKLTNEALRIALWDMEAVSADPANPANPIIYMQEFRQMLGFSDASEFPDVLDSWIDRLHPGDRERSLYAFTAHINDYTGKTPFDAEYRLLLKNGGYRWFRAFGTTLRDETGKPLRVAGALMDINESKNVRNDIEYRDRLLNAANNATAMLLDTNTEAFESKLYKSMRIIAEAVDVHRVCIWKNHIKDGRRYCVLLQEWVSERRPIVSAYYPTDVSYDDVLHGWYEALSQGNCLSNHVGRMSVDEQAQLKPQKIQSLFVTPIFVKDAFWGYVGFDDCLQTRDFTENEKMILRSAGRLIGNAFLRNEMERETLEALDEAQEANRAKSEFLSHISHEIRTPMNAILGTVEIQLQNEACSPETEEALGIIYNSGYLLLDIINDMLDHSKIEAAKLELVPVKYDIPSLIHDTVQLNILRYESKPINFKLKLDENTPLEMYGDELRIKQILNNILSNAFKYTDGGEVELSVSSEPDETPGVILVLRVSDTGQGMSNEQVDQLFEAYTRFNMEANRTTVGTGLGMSITKRLVDLMNGVISVESEPGKGSVFTVRLPQERIGTMVCGAELAEIMQQSRFQTSMTRAKKAQIIHEYMPYGKVLIVDDVESNLYVAKGMMLPYGLKIETAGSGIEAVEKIRNGNTYDVVFMDHMMPRMDGMEAVKIIRGMAYKNAIVALTANTVSGQAEIFLSNGFDAFISKPIDIRELNAALNHLIRDKQPPETVEKARQEMEQKKTGSAPGSVQDSLIKENLLEAVVSDVKNALAVLEYTLPKVEARDETEIKLFTTTVHGLKSAFLNIGDTELSIFALRLEQAGRNGDVGLITNETPEFIKALKRVVNNYQSEETNSGDGEFFLEDKIFLREKLSEIKTSCEKLDVKSAKVILAELKQKTWPVVINDILNEISLCLVRAECRKVAIIAEETAYKYVH